MYRALAEVVDQIEQGIRQSHRPEDRKLATDYLALLHRYLLLQFWEKTSFASCQRSNAFLDIRGLIDDGPFRGALAKWREFREEYETFAPGGMTVNERLAALGNTRRL